MLLKTFHDEDFNNYRLPSMILGFPYCTFKCDECLCQNSTLAKYENVDYGVDELIKRYLNNHLTRAIVFGGLEPLDSFKDVKEFIHKLRWKYRCNDPVIIYTGYEKEEISEEIRLLSYYPNVILKVGRYEPNQKRHYDDILGVYLASDNQYAFKVS
jgi:hypothetical protein